jgi:DNA-binding CsgD family transcriptional regulator
LSFDGLEGAVGSTNPRLSMALEVSELVALEDRPYEELLDLAAEIVCRTLGDVCVIALLSDDGSELHPLGLGHSEPELHEELRALADTAWMSSERTSERVLTTGKPVLLGPAELEREARDKPWVRTVLDATGLRSAVALPMRTGGARIGLLGVASHGDSRLMWEDDLPILQGVADRLALAVENMRLKEEIDRLRNPPHEPLPDPRLTKLTQRELQILTLIGGGLSSREIGERLFLSVRTVEWHRRSLSAKVGARQRSDLVALALTLPE